MPTQSGTPRHRADRHRADRYRADAATRAGSARQRGRHASSYGDGFGRFAGITTLALLPGAGLLAVGRRKIGLLLLLLAGLTVAVLAAFAVSGDVVDRVLHVAVSPNQLLLAAVAAVVIGAVWCVTILLTAWRARPERPSPFQGLAGVVLVAALCLAVAAPSAKGAQLAMVQRDLVTSVFGSGSTPPKAAGAARPDTKADDPWRGVARVNLLLLGSDAGADRTGVRTDSMMVASINTKTGNTVLIGLPRSLQRVPFPESNPLHRYWPNGFDCGSECLLNAVWDQAAVQHASDFPGNSNPGLTTTRDVISEVLGLRIDAYTTIDLRGFQSLVNAMGGVDANVPRRIPIGGGHNQRTGGELPITGWIEPGRQHLNGYQALWFSRSRTGSDDYDRMRRQRCMVGNLVDQVNPVRLLAKYGQLATVLKRNISTDIPQDQLQAWVVLVQRMQKGKITSLPLTNKVIDTVNPDFDAIRAYVKDALNPVKRTTPATSGTPGSTATKTSTPSGTSTGSADSSAAQDLAAVC
jgi:polyisoprenyl-teichoic acid--peptidoglycan teichoic acid transferase